MYKTIRYSESAHCWLPPKLEHVAPALSRLEFYLTVRGLPTDVWKGIELAVAEALNNAILHGCKDGSPKGVDLRWTWRGETLFIVVSDPSNFLPPVGGADLPEDPLAESGRGSFLMASLMDSITHRLTGGCHEIEMKKKVGPSTWSPHLMAESEASLDSLTSELSSCYENLSAVFRFAEILATAGSFCEFTDTVLQRLNGLLQVRLSYLRMKSSDGYTLQRTVVAGDFFPGLPDEIDLRENCLETEVFHTCVGQSLENCSTLLDGDPLYQTQGILSVYPVFFHSEVLGCVTVLRSAHGAPFSAAELSLIRVVADFLGIAYVTGRLNEQRQSEEKMKRELEIASSIQQSLLPRTFPALAPYHTFGLCRSAREIGGDYFDIVPIEGKGLLLVIADVMGKGMPAALLATVFRTAVRGRLELAESPGRLLSEVNRQLASDLDHLDMFITAKIAFLSYSDHLLRYADAGHCPILIRKKGQPTMLQVQADGFPIGVSRRYEYPQESYRIEAEDLLLFITDGIYENLNEHGLASSFDYLMQQILTIKERNLSRFCDEVLSLSGSDAVDKPHLDDRTILVLERGA